MDATDKHHECQSLDEQRDALRMERQMIVLDRQPYSEEKREQCEGLEVDADLSPRTRAPTRLGCHQDDTNQRPTLSTSSSRRDRTRRIGRSSLNGYVRYVDGSAHRCSKPKGRG